MAKKKTYKGRKIIINLSLQDKISALYLCADILDYPDNNYFKNIKKLENLVDIKLISQEVSLEEICSEHVRIFSMNATVLRCVPYASWWLDGKMSGKSASKIIDFYISCGYSFDAEQEKRPADNISSMISFIAILVEDKKHKELKEFAKFLNWMDDFASSVDKATQLNIYTKAVNTTITIINSLKEEL
jgi:TorA maturation chaperone TorD